MLFFKQAWILGLFSTFVDGSEHEGIDLIDTPASTISRPGGRPPPPPPIDVRDATVPGISRPGVRPPPTPRPKKKSGLYGSERYTAESILLQLGGRKSMGVRDSIKLLAELVQLPILDFVDLVADQSHTLLFSKVEAKWEGFIAKNQARVANAGNDQEKKKSRALEAQLNNVRQLSSRLNLMRDSLVVGIAGVIKNRDGGWPVVVINALQLPCLYTLSDAVRELGTTNPQLALDVTDFDLFGFFHSIVPPSVLERMTFDVSFADLRLDDKFSLFLAYLDYDEDSKKFRYIDSIRIFQDKDVSDNDKAVLLTIVYSYFRFRIDSLQENIRFERPQSSASLSLVNPTELSTLDDSNDLTNTPLEADRDPIDTPTGSHEDNDEGGVLGKDALLYQVSLFAQNGPKPTSLSVSKWAGYLTAPSRRRYETSTPQPPLDG